MRIGTVAQLYRYPVKSMQDQALSSTPIGLQGVPGDRRYAFVQAEKRGAFPWLTGREIAKLLLYRPEYVQPYDGTGREPALRVHTPAGTEFDIAGAGLRAELEQALGAPLFLLRDHRGSYDTAQLSLFSLGLADELSARHQMPIDPRRFRANLYVRPDGVGSLPERDWPGRTFTIGAELRLAVTEPDQRCMMIALDPETAQRDPALHQLVVNEYGNRAGVYAVVLRPGTVTVGDAVELES